MENNVKKLNKYIDKFTIEKYVDAHENGVINDWEFKFIKGMFDYDELYALSDKQIEIINKINEKVKEGKPIVDENYVFTFGKYKGECITNVPKGYIQFCVNNIKMFSHINVDEFYEKYSVYIEEDDHEPKHTPHISSEEDIPY